METIARLIASVLKNPADESIIGRVRQNVYDLCEAFPVYQD